LRACPRTTSAPETIARVRISSIRRDLPTPLSPAMSHVLPCSRNKYRSAFASIDISVSRPMRRAACKKLSRLADVSCFRDRSVAYSMASRTACASLYRASGSFCSKRSNTAAISVLTSNWLTSAAAYSTSLIKRAGFDILKGWRSAKNS